MPEKARSVGRRSCARVLVPKRASAAERGYGSRWQMARLAYLSENPCCVKCRDDGKVEEATVVDHIIPHRGDEVKFWDESNWQPLCKWHHDRKTGGGE